MPGFMAFSMPSAVLFLAMRMFSSMDVPPFMRMLGISSKSAFCSLDFEFIQS